MRDTDGPMATLDAASDAIAAHQQAHGRPSMVVAGFTQAQIASVQRAAQMERDNARRVVEQFFRARPGKPKPRRKGSKLARRCAARGRGGRWS
jgi:hypothetical protein